MKHFIYAVSIIAIFLTSLSSKADTSKTTLPIKGIYDAQIDDQKILLIIEESSPTQSNGFYLLNNGKQIETTHTFSISIIKNKILFKSSLYNGKIKGYSDSISIKGKIVHTNLKKKFLFFHQRSIIELIKRPDVNFTTSARYNKSIFAEVLIKKDIKYGKAPGYWTQLPSDNVPYIDLLSKGMANAYKETDSLELKMDIYQPKSDLQELRPLVLFIHGGAFYIGSKQCSTARQICIDLAKKGYVVASIDYRMGFKFKASDIERSGYRAVQDAHAALRFLAHNSKEHKIDPNQVYVAGTSAGAVASLNVAYMDNDERPESVSGPKKSDDLGLIEASGNTLKSAFQIKAIGNMWGAVTDINIIDIDELIPVFSVHGTADDIVPFAYDYPFQKALLVNRVIMNKMHGSKPIHDKLNQLNIKNKLIALEGSKHEPQTDEFGNFNAIMDTITINLSQFFYEITAPAIIFPKQQLSISATKNLIPFYCEITNGELVFVKAIGGVKASNSPTDLSIIWFRNFNNPQLILYTKNKYNAWNVKTYQVQIDK